MIRVHHRIVRRSSLLLPVSSFQGLLQVQVPILKIHVIGREGEENYITIQQQALLVLPTKPGVTKTTKTTTSTPVLYKNSEQSVNSMTALTTMTTNRNIVCCLEDSYNRILQNRRIQGNTTIYQSPSKYRINSNHLVCCIRQEPYLTPTPPSTGQFHSAAIVNDNSRYGYFNNNNSNSNNNDINGNRDSNINQSSTTTRTPNNNNDTNYDVSTEPTVQTNSHHIDTNNLSEPIQHEQHRTGQVQIQEHSNNNNNDKWIQKSLELLDPIKVPIGSMSDMDIMQDMEQLIYFWSNKARSTIHVATKINDTSQRRQMHQETVSSLNMAMSLQQRIKTEIHDTILYTNQDNYQYTGTGTDSSGNCNTTTMTPTVPITYLHWFTKEEGTTTRVTKFESTLDHIVATWKLIVDEYEIRQHYGISSTDQNLLSSSSSSSSLRHYYLRSPNEMYDYVKRLLTSTRVPLSIDSSKADTVQFRSIKPNSAIFLTLMKASLSIQNQEQRQQQLQPSQHLYNTKDVPIFVEKLFFDLLDTNQFSKQQHNNTTRSTTSTSDNWTRKNKFEIDWRFDQMCLLVLQTLVNSQRGDREDRIYDMYQLIRRLYRQGSGNNNSFAQSRHIPSVLIEEFISILVSSRYIVDIELAEQLLMDTLNDTPTAISKRSWRLIYWAWIEMRLDHENSDLSKTDNNNNNLKNSKSSSSSSSQEQSRRQDIIPHEMVDTYLQILYRNYSRAFTLLKDICFKLHGDGSLANNYNYDTTTSMQFSKNIGVDREYFNVIVNNVINPWRIKKKENGASTASDFDSKKRAALTRRLNDLGCEVGNFLINLHRRTKIDHYKPKPRTIFNLFKVYAKQHPSDLDKAYEILLLMKHDTSATSAVTSTSADDSDLLHDNNVNTIDDVFEKRCLMLLTVSRKQLVSLIESARTNSCLINHDDVITNLTRMINVTNLVQGQNMVAMNLLLNGLQTVVEYYTSNPNAVVIDMLPGNRITTNDDDNNYYLLNSTSTVLYTIMDDVLEKLVPTTDGIGERIQSLLNISHEHTNDVSDGDGRDNIIFHTILLLAWSKQGRYDKCWDTFDHAVHELHTDNKFAINDTSIQLLFDVFMKSVNLQINNDDVMRLLTIVLNSTTNKVDMVQSQNNFHNPIHTPNTNLVNMVLRVLAVQSTNPSMAMDAALKVYNKLSTDTCSLSRQSTSSSSSINQPDTTQTYALLYQIINQHKSEPIFIPLRENIEKILQLLRTKVVTRKQKNKYK